VRAQELAAVRAQEDDGFVEDDERVMEDSDMS
jgi:hypothetical protein